MALKSSHKLLRISLLGDRAEMETKADILKKAKKNSHTYIEDIYYQCLTFTSAGS